MSVNEGVPDPAEGQLPKSPQRPFQLLVKPVSYRCNLRCAYCYYLRVADTYPDAEEERAQMSEETLATLIEDYLALQFDPAVFVWQGGEPTLAGLDLFRHVVALQQRFGAPGQRVGNALQTNGMCIDEEWARFLGQYRFMVGLSLDGPRAFHDRYRRTPTGKSVWPRVMDAAALLHRHDVALNILCVVSDANVEHAATLLDFFVDAGFTHLQFLPAVGADAANKRLSASVTADAYGRFLCELATAWKPLADRVSIRLFDSLHVFLNGGSKGYCALEPECADYLLIEHNGDAYPCDFFVRPKWHLGNIHRSSLRTLFEGRERAFAPVAAKYARSSRCRECQWLRFCYGGCPKNREVPFDPRPDRSYLCAAYRRFFPHFIELFSA